MKPLGRRIIRFARRFITASLTIVGEFFVGVGMILIMIGSFTDIPGPPDKREAPDEMLRFRHTHNHLTGDTP